MTTHIHTPDDPRVFVFGSNLLGIHGAGAAKYAREQLDGVRGIKEGCTRPDNPRSYALPTCRRPGLSLPLRGEGRDFIEHYVKNFLAYARLNQDLRFFVSKVGCGLAGYREADIAPMFAGSPDNCDLPPGWRS